MRITRRVSRDLEIWMVGFGLLVGAAFPLVMLALGISRDAALRPVVFLATMAAGAVVGVVNSLLAKSIVGPRLRTLAKATLKVETDLRLMSESEDSSLCNARDNLVPVNSDDEIGDSASAFNRLATTLCEALNTERAVRSFVKVITTNLDLGSLAHQALDVWLEQSGASGGTVFYDQGGRPAVAATQGIRNPDAMASSDHVAHVFRTGESELIVLPQNVKLDGLLAAFTPTELLILPARYEGVPLGVIVLATAGHFEPEARMRAELSAQAFALALNNALAHERLQKLAALDPLTGIYNRRFGLSRLHEEFERAVRAQSHLGVLMMDIDLFKGVNDTYGHLVGDRVLKATAAAVRRILREGDVLVRYGGEEFLAILPAASSDDLALIGERMRRSVEDISVPEGHQMIRVTISIGGAALSDSGVEKEADLVELADAALYQAKQTGRNKVQIVN
jgi:two-component system, cell cycle response regulator